MIYTPWFITWENKFIRYIATTVSDYTVNRYLTLYLSLDYLWLALTIYREVIYRSLQTTTSVSLLRLSLRENPEGLRHKWNYRYLVEFTRNYQTKSVPLFRLPSAASLLPLFFFFFQSLCRKTTDFIWRITGSRKRSKDLKSINIAGRSTIFFLRHIRVVAKTRNEFLRFTRAIGN